MVVVEESLIRPKGLVTGAGQGGTRGAGRGGAVGMERGNELVVSAAELTLRSCGKNE